MAATSHTLVGVGVGRGSATGPVVQVHAAPQVPATESVEGDPEIVARAAFARVAADLRALSERAIGAVKDVLEATAEMADDELLHEETVRRIEAGTGPARAVDEAVEAICASFNSAGGYLAERVTDVRSVRHRVVAELIGAQPPGVPTLEQPAVLIANDLAPADTASLDYRQILAIVTERGGPTGHTAIIAGQLGIPCVVQAVGACEIDPGTVVAVDAATGRVVVNPDEALIELLERRTQQIRALAQDTAPGATSDGHAVPLLANIGTAKDLHALEGFGAEGVGLFRTEILYLSRATPPSVEEQAAVYGEIFGAMGGRKVIVRTLDCGADKPIPFATQGTEENPALGVRGYRLSRRNPALLADQLAAIALAARRTGAQPWVMAPMISTAAEAEEFAERARATGIQVVGAMVEVPAAAWAAEQVLRPLDFVSLGTNDLAQYTMGADRSCTELSDLLDAWQPAVLGLVARTIAAGRVAGKPVSVCGESASDPAMALVLTGLGVSSLSMSPSALPAVRFALRSHTRPACESLASIAIAATSANEGRRGVLAAMDGDVRTVLALGVGG